MVEAIVAFIFSLTMIYTDITLEEVSRRLKDGDSLGFYQSAWWAIFAHAIKVFTGGAISHVGKVYEVIRSPDNKTIKFKFAEVTYKYGGIYRDCQITMQNLYGKEYYFIEGFENSTSMYYLELKTPLTEEGRGYGIQDAIDQVSERHYGANSLLHCINWINNLFPKMTFAKFVRNQKSFQKVCSTFCQINDWKNGSLSRVELDKDFYVSPVEYSELPHLTLYRVVG